MELLADKLDIAFDYYYYRSRNIQVVVYLTRIETVDLGIKEVASLVVGIVVVIDIE